MFFKSKIGFYTSLLGVFFLLLCLTSVKSFMLDDRIRKKLKASTTTTTTQKKSGGGLLNLKLNLGGSGKSPKTGSGPLFLTPLIEKGEYTLAQQKAAVPPFISGVESFSGFITVDKSCESNLFFWLFKALEGDWKTKPVIIWLQGGPGVSGIVGLFREIGPYFIDAEGKLAKRKYAWCQKYNLMFIDNPVGTGFSFTKKDAGYANTETDVAEDLYSFITQFYCMFPELLKNPLFIMGESYAGKYIPAFSHYIYGRNKENASCNKGCIIPLEAVAIGNGWTDPFNMLHYGKYVYQLGLIDRKVRDVVIKFEDEARSNIKAGEYVKAHESWRQVMDTIYDRTGLLSLYNYVNDDVSVGGPEVAFMDQPEVREALHVGNIPFVPVSDEVHSHLENDNMQSVKPLIEDILEWAAFDFVAYSGQLDIICAYPLSESVYYNLEWKNSYEYKNSSRCLYGKDGRVVGYTKSAGVFTEIMFRNCGHLAPTDQPEVLFDFLDLFVTNRKGLRC